MSGIKRVIAEKDPDYEEITITHPSKRHKAAEQSARDVAVQKIETIIKEQFAVEMKSKEHEIEVIDQRLIEARRMMDKLRACIVANYYASAGLLKAGEGTRSCDATILNHPSIKKFLESPSRSSSPANQGSDTPSANHSETDSLSQHNDFLLDKDNGNLDADERLTNSLDQRQSRNTGRVVDVELHRHSLGEEYLFSQSSESDLSDVPTSLPLPLSIPAPVKASSPIKQLRDSSPDASVDKGFPGNAETERHATFYSLPSSIERTPTKLATQKVTFGSHGNSAFQPIAASCKIVPQGQSPSPAESPGKSFQPITMSCKIVSGSPISTPSPSPLPRTPTSTPVHMKQGSASSVINNPYIIVDKPGQMVGAAATSTGSPTSKLTSGCQASHGTGSPVSKTHGSSFVTSTVKVIIKQEPGELPQQPQLPTTGTTTQTSVQQYVTVKGSHMLALSPQKPVVTTGEGTVQSKVVGVPVGSALQSTVKQAVAISGGQILVAKSSSSVAKAVGPKQVVTQGVAKAIAAPSGQTSLVKISDGSIKSVPASSQLSKPGTTVLRVSGGVITTAAAPAVALPTNGVAQQIDNAGSSSSSSGTPAAKTSGQQHQICISQSQSTPSVVNKTATSTVVSVASLMTTPTPVTGKAAVSGLLKIHSNQSSPQQAVLTVPSQLKQLGVNTASGGVQTILMPMNKVIQSLSTSKVSAVTAVTTASTVVPTPSTASITKECPSSYSSGEELCRKLEELQQFLKREPEHEEEVDILNFSEPLKINIKKEQEEKQEEVKFYLASLPASEFVRDAAEKVLSES
ncbi:yeats hypothetical protein [Limosa lapponica baueri]|uniref:Uncharacterized protein n=1 Tax=Limosa lapponica baueri TaxID=1758121 RepID=A0A2I0TQN7_LIMLA|nr:yeats hypothetical protein [Limosa lapponica baueri]